MLYTFICTKCKNEDDVVRTVDNRDKKAVCTACGGKSSRVFVVPRVCCNNEDAEWIRTCHVGFSKKDSDPRVREYLKHPTRTNLKAAMKAKGLRNLDPAEKFEPDKYVPHKDPSFMREMQERRMERERIEVR